MHGWDSGTHIRTLWGGGRGGGAQWPWLIQCWTMEGDLQNMGLFDVIIPSTKF